MQESGDKPEAGISGYFVAVPPAQSTSGPSLVDIKQLVSQFRWLLLGLPLVMAILFVLASFFITPQYRVSVLLAPVETSPGGDALASLGALGGLGALAGIDLGGSGSVNESIAVLESKSLTTRFMRDENLMPVLFAGDWDADNQRWNVADPQDAPTFEDAFRLFDEEIRSVTSDRETGLVTLTITWSDREQAAAWANQLVARANQVIRERAIDEAQRSIDYLNRELEKTNVVGVRQAIYSVIESQIEQVMLANVRTDYAFKVLDPAVAPDADDTAFPSRPLFLLAGLVVGFAIAAAIALARLR